jgi:autotransporter strand-loop-strand O-heptosyltransferase
VEKIKSTISLYKLKVAKTKESIVQFYWKNVVDDLIKIYQFVGDKTMSTSAINIYNRVKKNDIDNQIIHNFVDGAFLEIRGNLNRKYNVSFFDNSDGTLIYGTESVTNTWSKTNRKWFTDWKLKVDSDNGSIEYTFDLKDKRVFIVFESSSLGDTLAWMPYVEEFRKKHNCKVILSTFHNYLFESEYAEIEFVNPGSSVENIYALYRVGVFYSEDGVDFNRHKTDFTKLSLQEIACDILGLDYAEIRPRIKHIEPMSSDKPYICIANHSTAQSKYWNNPTGWQELVDYVKSLGYDVYLLSREEDGYMGNKNPKGVIKVDGKSLEEIGSILLGSQGFIGLGSGLSWLSWALQVPTILISGFSEPYQEMKDVYRIINEDVCHGCFARHIFDRGDWNWCPDHKGTERQFECTKSITFQMVKPKIDKMLNL